MALDATVAGSAADSYLTVAAADGLAAADSGPEASAWLAASVEAREAALKRATREVDAYLRTGWAPYATTQRLRFPRIIDVDSLGAIIPRNVQLATYEQATYVLRNAAVLDQAAIRRARGLTSAAEPNVAYTRPAEESPADWMSPAALRYLEGYRHVASRRGIRSLRMGSGYAP